jgi:ABC-type antimicrobial peptide transport system permease subunit
MEDYLAESTAGRRFLMALMGAFAALAVAMASVGLYGVIAYAVTQRRHEIGIRVALGARRADVLGMVVRHGLALVAAGTVVGGVGAAVGARVLRRLVFGVSTLDTGVLGGVALLLVAVALLASWLPARRAAAVDPMTALRAE